MGNFDDNVELADLLATHVKSYNKMVGSLVDLGSVNSFQGYENKVNSILDLQFKASYILTIAYELQSSLRNLVKRGGSNIVALRKTLDELAPTIKYFESETYNLSRSASTLASMAKLKHTAVGVNSFGND